MLIQILNDTIVLNLYSIILYKKPNKPHKKNKLKKRNNYVIHTSLQTALLLKIFILILNYIISIKLLYYFTILLYKITTNPNITWFF